MAIPIWIKYSFSTQDNNYKSLDQPQGIKFYGTVRMKEECNGVTYLEGCVKRKWQALGRVEDFNRYRQWFSVRSADALLLVRIRKRDQTLDLFIIPGKVVCNSERTLVLKKFIESWAPI